MCKTWLFKVKNDCFAILKHILLSGIVNIFYRSGLIPVSLISISSENIDKIKVIF